MAETSRASSVWLLCMSPAGQPMHVPAPPLVSTQSSGSLQHHQYSYICTYVRTFFGNWRWWALFLRGGGWWPVLFGDRGWWALLRHDLLHLHKVVREHSHLPKQLSFCPALIHHTHILQDLPHSQCQFIVLLSVVLKGDNSFCKCLPNGRQRQSKNAHPTVSKHSPVNILHSFSHHCCLGVCEVVHW